MEKTILIALLLFSTPLIYGQGRDTLPAVDSAVVITQDSILPDSSITEEPKGWLKKDYPSPKKALLIGLAVPGGGQIYNKSWWKLPIVYGAVVGMGFTINYNQGQYRRLRDALDSKRNGEPHEFENTTLDNLQTLKNLRDEFDKNTQLAYVGMFLVYTLQAMEAFVDAHLKSFDIEDDIGMKIRPETGYIPALGTTTVGIGLSIPLHRAPLLSPASHISDPFVASGR